MKWSDRLKTLLLNQLKQGVRPHDLSWTIAWGITLSIFPILGSTTLLCFLVATRYRFNQPVIQAVNYAASPLQLLLIPVFMRIGERIFHLPEFPFNPSNIVSEFLENPGLFLSKGGLSGLAGVAVWLVVAYPIAFIIRKATYPWLLKIIPNVQAKEEIG